MHIARSVLDANLNCWSTKVEYMSSTIHCIGDSHSSFFCGQDRIVGRMEDNSSCLLGFQVYYIGPVLAYNLCEENSSTKGREIIFHILKTKIPMGSRLLLCFGEIDCRYHILKQADCQNIRYCLVVDECVARYVRFIKEIKSNAYDVYIWNATPTAPDSSTTNSAYPRYGTEPQRNGVTAYFNNRLQSALQEIEVPFVSIFDQLIDSRSYTRREYLMDGIHLSQKAMPLAKNAIKLVVPTKN